MQGVNRVILFGSIGNNAELRYSAEGKAVASFSVATHLYRTLPDGSRDVETEWHRVAAFGKTAEVVAPLLVKGSKVYVEGRLRHSRWTDKEGIQRYTTEIWGDRVHALTRSQPAAAPTNASREEQEPEGAELPF